MNRKRFLIEYIRDVLHDSIVDLAHDYAEDYVGTEFDMNREEDLMTEEVEILLDRLENDY